MVYHLKLFNKFNKFINIFPTSLRKIFFLNNHDESKRNSILFFIIISITVCEFFIAQHFSYSNSNSTQKLVAQEVLSVLKKDSFFLDLVIIIAFFSTFLIGKFINKLYPLIDGVDLNTYQKNITIRAETFMTIIENLDIETVTNIASDIGLSFAENIAKRHEGKIKTIKTLERYLKATDVNVAYFFKDLKIVPPEHDEIQIILYGPFWREKLQDKNNNNKHLPNICSFFAAYFSAIIEQFDYLFVKENSNQCISTATPTCSNSGKCYLLQNNGYCKYILKINEDAKI